MLHDVARVLLLVEHRDRHLARAEHDVVDGENEPARIDERARAHALGAEEPRGRMLRRISPRCATAGSTRPSRCTLAFTARTLVAGPAGRKRTKRVQRPRALRPAPGRRTRDRPRARRRRGRARAARARARAPHSVRQPARVGLSSVAIADAVALARRARTRERARRARPRRRRDARAGRDAAPLPRRFRHVGRQLRRRRRALRRRRGAAACARRPRRRVARRRRQRMGTGGRSLVRETGGFDSSVWSSSACRGLPREDAHRRSPLQHTADDGGEELFVLAAIAC